jgi:RND family efflux transporter MFP subunit
MNKKIIAVIFIAIAVLLGIKGKSLLKQREQEVQNTPKAKVYSMSVKLIKAKEGKLEEKSRYLATLKGDKNIKLSTKLAGFVQKVYVQDSQLVKKGDLLVKIDAKELTNSIDSIKANLSALKSDLELSKKIYSNNKKLYKVGGLPKEKLQQYAISLKVKEAKINESEQKIKSLQNQLSYLNIRAPFSGIVDKVLLHEGDLAAAGKPIIALSNSAKKLVFSYVAGDSIKVGQDVLLNAKSIGEVATIYNSAQNSLVSAEIKLHSAIDLPLGSSVNIDILTKSATGCIVPNRALIQNKNRDTIVLYSDKKFIQKEVEVLIENGDSVLIKSCPKEQIAVASQSVLTSLPAMGQVGVKNEK